MQTHVLLFGTLVLGSVFASQLFDSPAVEAGEILDSPNYKVLPPIRHGNLTVFPVVATKTYDTSEFLTLDEGIKSGEVVVTEYGNSGGLVRNPGGVVSGYQSARVNTLVLINNSKRPLILLAGEIVTGGKQDRVIGKDRLVPAESDPIDLSVFCVEHGRWVASSDKFGTMSMNMAAPSVRGSAMGSQNQQMVWDSVGRAKAAAVAQVPAASGAVGGMTSYAKVMDNGEIKQQVDAMAKPLEEGYSSTIKQLRDRHAVGVVVAVNGQFVWADLFASTSLLEKYWPKLVRSYATEAVVTRAKGATVSESGAQAFLDHLDGRHETIDREPGLYRHTEVSGDGFKAFELTSLLPKTDFPVHIAKMVE